MISPSSKPARLKGLLWGLFSATAMFSAFVLPVHLFALLMGGEMKLGTWYFIVYFAVVLSAALFHGLYRAWTVKKDLGF